VLAFATAWPGWTPLLAVAGFRAWNPALVFADDVLLALVVPLLAVATGTPRIPVHWLQEVPVGPVLAFIMG
jgi:hypothetical protein